MDKLSELKKVGDKVVMRYEEAEGRQGALNLLGTSLVQVRKVLELIKNKVGGVIHKGVGIGQALGSVLIISQKSLLLWVLSD